MRKEYFDLLIKNNLPNTLGEIQELAYSKKIKIIEELLNKFELRKVKIALNMYKQNYIDIGRVDLMLIKNILKGLCK